MERFLFVLPNICFIIGSLVKYFPNNKIKPIKVFNMNTEGNLQKICDGENVGTLVKF